MNQEVVWKCIFITQIFIKKKKKRERTFSGEKNTVRLFWRQKFFRSRNTNNFRCCRICFNLISWKYHDGISTSSGGKECCSKSYLSLIHIKVLCCWPASSTLLYIDINTGFILAIVWPPLLTAAVATVTCKNLQLSLMGSLHWLIASSISSWAWTQHLLRC